MVARVREHERATGWPSVIDLMFRVLSRLRPNRLYWRPRILTGSAVEAVGLVPSDAYAFARATAGITTGQELGRAAVCLDAAAFPAPCPEDYAFGLIITPALAVGKMDCDSFFEPVRLGDTKCDIGQPLKAE